MIRKRKKKFIIEGNHEYKSTHEVSSCVDNPVFTLIQGYPPRTNTLEMTIRNIFHPLFSCLLVIQLSRIVYFQAKDSIIPSDRHIERVQVVIQVLHYVGVYPVHECTRTLCGYTLYINCTRTLCGSIPCTWVNKNTMWVYTLYLSCTRTLCGCIPCT